MRSLIRSLAINTWHFLRAFWMIVGISIAMFLLAESCYRMQDSARSGLSSSISDFRNRGRVRAPAPKHPVASEKWYPEFFKEFSESSPQAWRPWVYFRRAGAYKGRYVNIDSLQHRVTPQPTTPAKPVAKVFFMGGSTMWGSFLRDSSAIPAVASRKLQALAGAGQRIDVTNFGESGHVNTQDMIELELQLRSGNIPDVVVFYDGINDTFSVLQNGEPGVGQNEMNRVVEFSTGRRLSWNGHDEGLAKDLHSFGVLATMGFERSRVVQRLIKLVRPNKERPLLTVDSAASAAVRVYTEDARMIEALAKTYGFTPMYVWQPTLHATEKKLTPFEERLMRNIKGDPFQHRLQELHIAMLPRLDSAMAIVAPGRFVNEGHLFKGDSTPVFSDQVGHNTEASIPVIVDGFFPTLEGLVKARLGAAPVRRP